MTQSSFRYLAEVKPPTRDARPGPSRRSGIWLGISCAQGLPEDFLSTGPPPDPAWQQSPAQPARANLEGPTRLLPFSQELINARPLTKLGDGAHPASTDQRVAADHDGQQSLVQPARANVEGPTRLSLPF